MNKRRLGLLAGGIVVLGIAVAAGSHWHPASAPVAPRTTYGVTPGTAAETPVADRYQWHGAVDEPRYLKLPAIRTEGFVQRVNLDHQQIEAPTNIHLAGWFSQSQKPGQPGLSIIDGHVDGATQPGIFKDLARLQNGDTITVQTGGNATFTYQVMKTVTVPAAAALNQLFSQDPQVPSQLNLITCSGNFDKSDYQYDKRTIVSTKLIL